MSKSIKIALYFFVLLEFLHLGGIFILKKIPIYGPTDFKDVFVIPLVLSIGYYFLLLVKWKINKGVLLGTLHIVLWSTILIISYISTKPKNCIDCESAEWFLEGITGLICSLFLILKHSISQISMGSEAKYAVETFLINLLLVGFYLYIIANLAKYIELKINIHFLTENKGTNSK
ncbi:MAG: hypothetical protein H6607_09275 [Flavobacteriales bacterium]|nr:hypothetical protein [Flavobacteriales bacterium]